jgi:hypothetical protein
MVNRIGPSLITFSIAEGGAFGASAAPARGSLFLERVSILNTLPDISSISASNKARAISVSDQLSSDPSPAIQLKSC